MEPLQATPETVRRELSGTEKVLWSGQPEQGLILRSSDIFLIPFSFLWCGFAVFWEWSAIHLARAPFIFRLWGIPFVAIGIHAALGRFFVEASQRKRTFYAVTSERVLIISGNTSRKVQSMTLPGLVDMSLTEIGNGRGSIQFGPVLPYSAGFRMSPGIPGVGNQRTQFDRILDARRVFELIRRTQAQ